MFNIDFIYLIQLLLPVYLRKPKQIAWLRLILSFIERIYNEFIQFKAVKLYDINFTGQLMYLEKKLQDTFNCSGIYISDGIVLFPFYLSNKAVGNLPVYFANKSENFPVYLSNNIEFTESPDFIVNIPESCYNNYTENERKQINIILLYYKLFDKTNIIKLY